MNCVICKNGELSVKTVKEEVHKGKDVVIVSINIPVCNQCGERYYDVKTMKYLENIEQELDLHREKLTEVGKVLVYG